jgi:hypothetical protein
LLEPRVAVIAGAIFSAFLFGGVVWLNANPQRERSPAEPPPRLILGANEVAGAVVALDSARFARPENLARLAMEEPEKARLVRELSEGRLRIGFVRLWDTADEDGDRIRIQSAGFSQDVTITKAPSMIFVPYLPGGTALITAIHDGGGGGITLGVATVLGPTPLPPLSVGQTLEIPIL